MTIRLDEENIVNFLHNFNKKHIRQGKHSNYRRKERQISFNEIIIFLTKKSPIHIEKQETKNLL